MPYPRIPRDRKLLVKHPTGRFGARLPQRRHLRVYCHPDAFAAAGGPPKVLRMDNGPELVSQALQRFCDGKVGLSYIPPGWRNGYIESFNARIRDECLNINIFWSLTHARVMITDWKHEYNHHRRHSALGYQAPANYAA